MDLSLVIPLYNEDESLEPLFGELLQVMTPLNRHYEIIFVNDCSTDQSFSKLEGFKRDLPEVVRVIDLKERNGQTSAMRKGLEAVKGKIVVTLDADLQNDPHDLPKLFEKLEEGYDCVCGWRRSRQDTFLKAFSPHWVSAPSSPKSSRVTVRKAHPVAHLRTRYGKSWNGRARRESG